MRALYVLGPDGEVYRGAQAALFVQHRCGWRVLPALFWHPPMKWMADAGYFVLARNRRLFAKFLYTKESGEE